jgi:hypothetical protein
MARVFVHVNETHKYVNIHFETNNACPDVFKHIAGGVYSANFPIERLASDTIKIGETGNSYWLIIWIDNPLVIINNQWVLQAQQKVGATAAICQRC